MSFSLSKKRRIICILVWSGIVLLCFLEWISTQTFAFRITKVLPVFTAGVVLTRFLFSDGAWDRLKKHWFAVVLFLFLEAVIAILSILFIVTKFGVSRLAGRVLILFTVLLMCVLALVVLWTVFFPQPIHRIYLLVALTVGSIMLLLTEPYHVPDENTHYMKVYAFSNALLGIPTLQDNQYYISKVDFEYYLKQIDHVVSDFSIEGVEQFWSDMVQFEDDSVLIKTSWCHSIHGFMNMAFHRLS